MTPRRASPTRLLVNVDVPDLEAAIRFYRRALGLRLGRRLFDGTVAELLGATSPIYLLAKRDGSRAGPRVRARRAYGRHWTPVHLDIAVGDLRRAVRRARAAGAVLEGAAQTHPWGRLALMADPFGHGFCLVQLTRRGYAAARRTRRRPRRRT